MTGRLAAWCAEVAVRHRLPILLVTLLLVAVALPSALRVPFNASIELWFLDNDPALRSYHEFHQVFGDDAFIMLATEVPEGQTVFNPTVLASIERATAKLESMDTLGRVVSLTRYETIVGDGDDLVLVPAITGPDMSAEELRVAEQRVLADPLALNRVVSADGRMAVALAEVVFRSGEFEYRIDLVDTINEFLREEAALSGVTYIFTGPSVLDADIFRDSRNDLKWNIPLLYLCVTVLLVITLRHLAGTLLPLAVVAGTVIMNRAMFGLLGWQENSLVTIVPLILTAVGIADSVHIVVHFLTLRGQGVDPKEAARETIRRLFKPCFLTSLTTAIGFLALLAAPMAPLQEMGALTGIGVIMAFLLSVFTLPAALSYLDGDVSNYTRQRSGSRLGRMVMTLPGFVQRRRGWILATAALLTVAAGVGITRLNVESNAIEFFRKDDPTRLETEYIQERIGGIGTLEVVVTANEAGRITDPEVLRAMDDLEAWLLDRRLITDSYSVVEYLKEINRAMHGGAEEYHQVPESRQLAEQYLLLYGASGPQNDLSNMLDITHTTARVGGRVKFAGSIEYRHEIAALRGFLAERFPETVTASPTGLMMLYKNMGDYVVASQVRSFLAALLIITLTVAAAFRSWRVGMLSMIPNVWPILLTLGFMGWAGIRLDMVNAMVAAVAIGIAVDDTVHFLSKYVDAVNKGWEQQACMEHAFRVSGRAIVYTTLILLAGFGVILRSHFLPGAIFAGLASLALFLALMADLFILPAICMTLRPLISQRDRSLAPAVKSAVLTVLALGCVVGGASAQTEAERRGLAIMEGVDTSSLESGCEAATVSMVLSDKGGRSITRDAVMVFWKQDTDERAFIRFSAPPDIRGTSFLTHSKEGDDDQWLYLPALDRVKRVNANRKSDSFVGTEFTYEDLGGRSAKDYTHTFLREEALGEERAEVVESRPRNPLSGYSRLVTWVSMERKVVLQVEYYDRKDNLLKTSRSEGFTRPDDRRWRFGVATVINAQNGRSTRLEVKEWDLDAKVDASRLTVESMSEPW